MATTLTASTLKVTVKEEITLNGKKHEYKQEQSIPSINMISQRIVRVPTSTEKILDFNSTTIGAGQYVAGDVKYIRITNLDDTNFVNIGIRKSSADVAYLKVEKGDSLLLNNTSLQTKTDGAGFSAFQTLTDIIAIADTAAVDIEIFVASSQS